MKQLNIENTGADTVKVEITNNGDAELVYQIIGGQMMSIISALSSGSYTISTGETMQITAGTYSAFGGYQNVSDSAEQCEKLRNGQFRITIQSGECKLTGDVTALITNEGGVDNLEKVDGEYVFQELFAYSGATIDAGELELPATTLANSCYESMFSSCTSLTTAPELPATTLAEWCYSGMFSSCTSLTTAPELPATTLAESCYSGMFGGCTSLTTAPELPVIALAAYCYRYMFDGCTSLTTAPELPATTLASNCYYGMFRGCTSLNYIKCLATDISATNCTTDWVRNVASSGTFICAEGMEETWIATKDSDYSHAPYSWTIQYEGYVPEPVGTLSLSDVTIGATDITATMTITATEIDTGTITVSDITYY